MCARVSDREDRGSSSLSATDCPAADSDEYRAMADRRVAYMSIVDGLNWLANMTRHDIAYATSQLSRFLSNPGVVLIGVVFFT